jgi:hypothetical protein
VSDAVKMAALAFCSLGAGLALGYVIGLYAFGHVIGFW